MTAFAQEVERGIITSFRKVLWGRFVKAVKEYALVEEGDEIAVCISGGKDSMLLAKCMQELQRHGEKRFGLKFLVMDPGYAPENRALIEENAERLGIPVHIFSTDIFAAVEEVQKNPCYLCARMRRGYLYEEARRLDCNKIALGHHFDDVIETILMGMLYGGHVWVLTHARRNLVHCQPFISYGPEIPAQPLQGVTLCTPAEAVAAITADTADATLVCGTGLRRNADACAPLENLPAVTCLPACIHASTEALCLLARHGDYAPEDIEPLYVRPCDAVDNLPDLARRQGRDSDAATAELERLLHLAPGSEI